MLNINKLHALSSYSVLLIGNTFTQAEYVEVVESNILNKDKSWD
jgi:hypothetical protein